MWATITVTPGVYTGSPTPTITRKWQKNNVDITPAETGLTLDTTGMTATDTVRCIETATNASGNVTGTSTAITLT